MNNLPLSTKDGVKLREENAKLKADLEHEGQLVVEYGDVAQWEHAAAAQAEGENAKLRAALKDLYDRVLESWGYYGYEISMPLESALQQAETLQTLKD